MVSAEPYSDLRYLQNHLLTIVFQKYSMHLLASCHDHGQFSGLSRRTLRDQSCSLHSPSDTKYLDYLLFPRAVKAKANKRRVNQTGFNSIFVQ